ncbi:uncharacterized protein LOC142572232 [Dermacentor variabilis]|uniref:uncharacterized protein LOC142572232 n=1 Tax=Dermacentor variabilis TaxID=34621 RepID=UPI003F5C5828
MGFYGSFATSAPAVRVLLLMGLRSAQTTLGQSVGNKPLAHARQGYIPTTCSPCCCRQAQRDAYAGSNESFTRTHCSPGRRTDIAGKRCNPNTNDLAHVPARQLYVTRNRRGKKKIKEKKSSRSTRRIHDGLQQGRKRDRELLENVIAPKNQRLPSAEHSQLAELLVSKHEELKQTLVIAAG